MIHSKKVKFSLAGATLMIGAASIMLCGKDEAKITNYSAQDGKALGQCLARQLNTDTINIKVKSLTTDANGQIQDYDIDASPNSAIGAGTVTLRNQYPGAISGVVVMERKYADEYDRFRKKIQMPQTIIAELSNCKKGIGTGVYRHLAGIGFGPHG